MSCHGALRVQADGLTRRAARVRRGDSRLRRARDLGVPEHDHHSDEDGGQDGRARLVRAPDPGGVRRLGGSFLDATLFLEETARGQIPIGAYGVTLIVVGALNRFGTEEQKRDLLGHVVKGGTLAIAMSEPDSGSDVASLKTRAKRDDNGEWVIDGAKMWCSYAHKASHVLIVCRTGEGERHDDMSMILVPREAEASRSRRSRPWAGRRPTSSTSTASGSPRTHCSAARAAVGRS